MARYWIGGSGSWSNTDHWSATSGGAKGASVPTSSDDVYFNANSFSADGQVVTLDINGSCKGMDWTGATNTPAFSMGTKGITISGSCTLITAMSVSLIFNDAIYQWYFLPKDSASYTINTAGHKLDCEVGFHGEEAFSYYPTFTLQSNLSCYLLSIAVGCTFDANDYNVTVDTDCVVNSDYSTVQPVTLYMGNGTWLIGSGALVTFTVDNDAIVYCEASTLKFQLDANGGISTYASLLSYNNADLTLNNVIFEGIEISGQDDNTAITIAYGDGDIVFNSIRFEDMDGWDVEFDNHWHGGTPISKFVFSSFSCVGGSESPINLTGPSTGSSFVGLSKTSGTIQVKNCNIEGCDVGGGATWYACNCTDAGSNSGWTWSCLNPTVNIGDEILISYKHDSTYGIKRADSTIKGTGIYYSLDLVAPKEFVKPLLWKSVVLKTKSMPTGTSIGLWYKIDKNGDWVVAYMQDSVQYHTSGQEAVFLIGAEGMIFEFKLQLNSSGNETPEVYLPIFVNFE